MYYQTHSNKLLNLKMIHDNTQDHDVTSTLIKHT